MTAKKIFLFIVLAIPFCTLFLSCGKHPAKPARVNSETLPGTWEIRNMWGPLIDINPDAFKPGNGNTWSFSNSEFEKRIRDSVYETGTYTTDNTGITNEDNSRQVQRFIFNGVASESFELRNDSLFVYSTQTDAYQYTSVYVKIEYIY